MLVLSMLALMFGTGNTYASAEAAAKGKKVKSISIVKPEISVLTMKKGSSYRLKTKVSPKTAKNKRVNYHSNKSSVASVSSRGIIAVKKEGVARITATAAQCEVCGRRVERFYVVQWCTK